MNDETKYTYFILIKIGEYNPTRDRLAETFQNLKSCFDWIAKDNHQLVFTSKNSNCFGYFIKTGLNNAHSVKAHILGTIHDGSFSWEKNKKKPTSSCLFSGDNILIIEIPDNGFSNDGFSRACTWLSHR